MGGKVDESKLAIEPAILLDVKEDDALMQQEIFGPLLPILEVDTLEDAVRFIRGR